MHNSTSKLSQTSVFQALRVKMAVTYKENVNKTHYWLKIQTVHVLSLVYKDHIRGTLGLGLFICKWTPSWCEGVCRKVWRSTVFGFELYRVHCTRLNIYSTFIHTIFLCLSWKFSDTQILRRFVTTCGCCGSQLSSCFTSVFINRIAWRNSKTFQKQDTRT